MQRRSKAHIATGMHHMHLACIKFTTRCETCVVQAPGQSAQWLLVFRPSRRAERPSALAATQSVKHPTPRTPPPPHCHKRPHTMATARARRVRPVHGILCIPSDDSWRRRVHARMLIAASLVSQYPMVSLAAASASRIFLISSFISRSDGFGASAPHASKRD